MSRRAASVTQADVARIIRAAKQAGAAEVEIKMGEQTVLVRFTPSAGAQTTLAPTAEVVL